jgi:Large polyvalent protein associated domain 38
MPYLQMPSGNVYKAPEGMSYEAALAKARADYPQEFGIKPQEGVGAAIKKGTEQMVGSSLTGIRSLFGNAPEAAREGAARNESIGQRYADQVGWDRVADKWNDPNGGFFSAAGELARQVPLAIAEQAPNIAATLGSAATGAALGSTLGPVGSVIGGGVGAFAPSFLQQLGGNVERQQEVTPGQINVGSAATAALPQAALDVAGTFIPMGKVVTGKVLGPTVTKYLERGGAEAAEKLAKESLTKTLAKGTAVGAMAEIPTEVAQQMLERYQAGLSLTDADAQKEYMQTAYQVGLLAPIGAAGRYVDRGGARTKIEATQQAESAKAAKAALDAENARKQTPEYLQELVTNYDTFKAKRDDLSAQIKQLGTEKKGASKEDARDIEAQIKALREQKKTAQKEFAPFEKEYGERSAEIRAVAAVPSEYEDLAKQKPFTPPPAPAPVTQQPGEEVPAGYEDLAISGEQRAPGAMPRVPSRMQPTQFLTQFTSPEARMAGEQFPDWQTSVAELVKRPDIARIVLSSGERFPGASSLSESNLWKKNLAVALQEKMQQPNTLAEAPEQDAQEAQIIQESQAQQAERERVAQARQQQELIAQGNRQMAETAQQKIAAEQQAFQDRLAQQREQDAIAEEVRGVPERDATANAALRAAEEAAQQGIAPIMPKAAESLQAGILTPEAATALRIRMTKEPLDLGDKATATSLAPQVDKRLALLEEAANRASAFELTDAQGNLNEQGHAYQRLLAQVTELRRIKGVLANTMQSPVPAMRQMAGQMTAPAPQVGPVELRPLDQAHAAYEDAFSHAMGSLDQVARGEFKPGEEGAVVDDARAAGSKVVDSALKRINAARIERGQAPLTAEVTRTLRSQLKSAYDALVARARRYDASPVIGRGKKRTTEERVRARTDASFGHIYGEPNAKNEAGTQEDTLTKVIQRFHAHIDSIEGARPPKETLPPITHRMIQAPLLETQTEESLAQQRAAAQGEGRPGKGQLLSHVEQTLGEIETMLTGRPQKKTAPVPKKGKGLAEMANLMKANYEARVANSVRQNMDPDTRGLLGKVQQFLMSGVESTVEREEDEQGNVQILNRSDTPVGEETERYPLNRQLNARFTQQFLDDVDAVVMRARNTVAPDPALARRLLDHINSIERGRQDERHQGDLFESEKATKLDDAHLERTRAVFEQEKQNLAKTGRLTAEIANLTKRVGEQDSLLRSLASEEKKQFDAMAAIDELPARIRELDMQLGDEPNTVALDRLRDGLADAEKAILQSTHFYGDAIQRFHDAKLAMDRMLTDFYSLRSTQERVDAISGVGRTIRALQASLKTNKDVDTVRKQMLEMAVRNVEILQKRLAKLAAQKKGTALVKAALANATKQLQEATARADRLLAKPTPKEVPGAAYIAPEGKATSQPKAVEPGTTVTTSKVQAAPLERLTTEESMEYAKAVREFEDNIGRKATRKEKAEILHDLRATTPALRQTVKTEVAGTAEAKREAEKERIREEMEDRRRQRESMREQKVKGIVEPLTLKQRAALLRTEDEAIVALEQANRAVPPARAAVLHANQVNKAHPTTENAARAKAASDTFKAALKAQKEAKAARKEATAALNAENRLINKSAKETAAMRREAAGAAASSKGEQVRKNLPSTGKGAPEPALRASKIETSGVPEFGTPPEKPAKFSKGKSAATKSIEKQIETEQATIERLEARKAAAVAAALEKGRKLTNENSPSMFALTHSIVQSKQKLVKLNKQLEVAGQQEEVRKSHERVAALQAQKKPIDEAPPASDAEKLYNEMQDKLERGETDKHYRGLLGSVDRAGPLDTAAPFHGMKLADAARWGAKNARGARAELFNSLADIFKGNDGVVLAARFHGFYEPNDNFVVVPTARTDTLGILLHELTHAATSRQMHASPEARAKVDALRKRVLDWTTTPEGRAYVRDNAFGLKNDKSESAQAHQGIYGLKNEGEFLAETFSNRAFQKMLAQIPSETPKQSIFSKFVDFVAALLKIDSPHARSALNDAIELTYETAGVASRNVESMEISHAPKYAAGYDKVGQDIENRLISNATPLRKQMRDHVMGFRMHFIDAFDPLQKIADKMADSVKALQMMYDLRMYKQASNATNEVALNGTLTIDKIKRPDGKIERMIKSRPGDNLRDIAKELKHAGVGDLDAADRAFKTYLIAERAERTGYESVVGHMAKDATVTEAELKNRLDAGRLNPVFKKVRGMYKNYADGLIDFAVETGALSESKGKEFKASGDYVSFYRQDGDMVNLIVDGERIMSIGSIKSQPYLKNLVGSTSPITGFLEGALQNTRLLTEMALRNLATKNTAETLNKEFYVDENGKQQPLAHIRDGDGPAQKNVVRFKSNGKPKHAIIDTDAIGIPTDILVTGLEGVATQLPAAFRLLGAPSRMLRQFIVRNPLYAARQVVRDSLANSLLAGVDGVPVASQIKEIGKMLTGRSDAERKLQERLIVGGQALTGDMDDKATILKQIGSGKLGWQTAMGKLDFWAMQADAAARVTAYNSARANGLTDMEATMAALETMNFNRRGVSPTMHALSTMIPFMNAQIQGLDVLYRAFTGKMPFNEQLKIKQKLYTRGMMMAATTMAYAAMMQGDDDYENASMQDKLNNWFLPIPGTDQKLRIPTPFEAGYLFKALPEALYTLAANDNKGGEVLSAFGQMALNSMPGVIPQGLKPMIEDALNREFYSGRDIEDTRMQAVKTSERYGDKTTGLAKVLGGSFEVAGREIGVSPARIEHYVRGYTGALGMALLGLTDGLVPSATEKPTRKINETPILGPLFLEKDATAAVSEAYKRIEQYGRAKATFDKMAGEGRIEEAERFADKYGDQIAKADLSSDVKAELGRLTKIEHQIRAADMTGDEKRDALDELRKEKIALSREALEALRE